MKNSTSKHKKFLAIAIVVMLAVLFRTQLYEFLFLMGDRDKVVAILSEYGAAGPGLLTVFLVLQVFLAWIPGHVLMIAGGYLYGFKTAFLITAVSTIVGSQLAFILARRAGRPLVDRFVPEKLFEKWDRAAEKQGALFFLLTFWVPIFPSDMMCFIAGIGKIKSIKFFAANFFGRLPCAAVLVLIGSDGYKLSAEFWLIAAGGIALIMVGWYFLEKRMASAPNKMIVNSIV